MRRLLPLLVLLMGCPEPPEDDPALARIGTATVRFSDLAQASRSLAGADLLPASGSGFESLRDRLVQELVVQEILLAEATQRGIAVPPEAVDAELQATAAEVGDDSRLAGFVDERYGSADAWRARVARRLRIEAVEQSLRDELAAGVVVAPEQVDSALPRFADQMQRPARIRVRQLFFPDAATAAGARLQLLDGTPFDELARALTGEDGDAGWMATDAAPPVLLRATDGVSVGEVSEVVESPLGYHLFQLVGREEPSALPDDEIRARVEDSLRSESVESRLRAWIAARSDALGRRVHEDAVEAIACCRLGLPYLAGRTQPEAAP